MPPPPPPQPQPQPQPPAPPLPAHKTKTESTLHYPLLPTSLVLSLAQSCAAQDTTGSTLWLGAQVLAAYLFGVYAPRPQQHRCRRRAIDLGAGVGLTAHALAVLGFDVAATDVRVVAHTVLARNAQQNAGRVAAWGEQQQQQQQEAAGGGCGVVEVRELDWLVAPDEWDWDGARAIAPREEGEEEEGEEGKGSAVPGGAGRVGPPFDLVVTADTLYRQDLVAPLLRTIKALCLQSGREQASKKKKFPPAYVALERRDPEVIEQALDLARAQGFECRRVPAAKVAKRLCAAGLAWRREDWEGVEIWKWVLKE